MHRWPKGGNTHSIAPHARNGAPVMKTQRKMRGRDARGQTRREQDYIARNEVQACTICGRLFTRHVKDSVCSIACAQKAEQQAKQQAATLSAK
jgi:hypothetical protein